MKKIVLIEDRYKRQNDFLSRNNIDLEQYEDILDNFIEHDADNILEQISLNSFNFEKYDIIICHKSVENNTIVLSTLQRYSKQYNKTLVFFSGGISVNYYNNDDFETLELNSKTFYSKNLKLFLEAVKNEDENILMLCYGENWMLNIASNILEKINKFITEQKEDDIKISAFESYIEIEKLTTLGISLYEMEVENGWVYLSEIENFKASLLEYCVNFDRKKIKGNTRDNSILIHNNNLGCITKFENRIRFTTDDDVDKYISTYIIDELKKKEFDTIFIKDNLSSNYLELYGLRVAYHIRLSTELKDKKFTPIVIISDFDEITLNRFTHEANILLTKNIYLIENSKEAIEKMKTIDFDNLTFDQYKTEFLDKIKIEQPKDYLSHHSIANEWSMYRWAEYLDVNTPDIQKIRSDISSMLYFKYLQAIFPIKRSLYSKNKQEIKGKGKILYIDDEWEKGWKSIFKHLTPENQNYSLETIEEVYKDKSQEEIIIFIKEKVINFDPDVVILDIRLHEDDFLVNLGLANLTGIKIFNQIKKINPGIQVIIFTASSDSLLLDELYSYDSSILGYVKKEHPKNYNLTTQDNINKLIRLINRGFEKKYLKNIYIDNKKIRNLLNIDIDNPKNNLKIFEKYNIANNKYLDYAMKIHKETNHIFDILNSNTSNKYPYAMLSIARTLEAILSIFITERQTDNIYWDKEDCRATKFEDKITHLMNKFGYEVGNLSSFVMRRNKYIHSNPSYKEVLKNEIEQWFHILLNIIKVIDNPPNYTPYIPQEEQPLFKRQYITTASGIKKMVKIK